jgi:hypothetical protein
MTHTPSFPAFGLRRRHVLGGFLAATALHVTPFAMAAEPVASPAFMALSQFLTARDDLHPQMGARMQAAWQELDDKFSANVEALWQWIQAENVSLAQLNERMKVDKPELSQVPAQIMQIWWQGIAGSGNHVRVVTYEHALNGQAVSDKLRPPSYAYGNYGSWSMNPTTFNLQRVTIRR